MAEGQADRGVIFTLKVRTDDSADQALGAFGDRFAKIQDKIDESAIAGGKRRGLAKERELQKSVQSEAKARQQQERDAASSLKRQTVEKAKAEREKVKLVSQTAKEEERIRKQAEREQAVILKRELADEKKQAKELGAIRAAAAKKQIAEQKAVDRAVQSSNSTIMAANRAITDGFTVASEGVIKLARGFALLSASNEKETAALMKRVVAIQAVIDVARGGIEIYRGLSAAVKAYQAAVTAAAVAEGVLSIARSKTASAGADVLLGSSIEVSGGTAETAGEFVAMGAGAHAGKAVTRRSISLAGKALMGVVSAAKAVAAMLLTVPVMLVAAGASLVAATAMVFNIGGARDAAAERIRASGFVDSDSIIGRVMGRVSSGVGGQLLGVVTGRESLGSLQANDLASREQTSRMQSRFAEQSGRAESTRQRLLQESAQSSQFEALQRGVEARQIEHGLTRRGLTGNQFDRARNQELGSRAGREARERQAELRSLRAQESQALAGGGAGATDPVAMERIRTQIEIVQQKAIEASRRATDFASERLEIEKRIAGERTAASEKAVENANKEVSIREQAIKAEENRLLSSKERFGQKTVLEQRRLIQLKQRADRGGQLNVEELQALGGVGTRATQEIASKAFRSRADQAGFSQVFGGQERERIARFQKQREQLEVTLKDQRELQVKIERDESGLVQRISQIIKEKLDQQDRQLIDQIKRTVESESRSNQRATRERQTNDAALAR